MSSKLVLGGAVVVVLAGAAAFVGASLASTPQPAPADPVPAAAPDASVHAQLEEFDRRIESLERRVEAVEKIATDARDLAEALRDRTAPAAARGPAASPATSGSTTGPTPGRSGTDAAAPEREMTDDERRAARIRQIQDTVRADMKRDLPILIRRLGDDSPKAAEKRVVDARIAARQMAVALALDGEQADRLHVVMLEEAERTAREVGPLVRDGLEKADVTAVRTAFDAIWDDVDRRAREIVGETKYEKFAENAGYMRHYIRDVLSDYAR